MGTRSILVGGGRTAVLSWLQCCYGYSVVMVTVLSWLQCCHGCYQLMPVRRTCMLNLTVVPAGIVNTVSKEYGWERSLASLTDMFSGWRETEEAAGDKSLKTCNYFSLTLNFTSSYVGTN